jgi:hypothetical protein
MKQTMVAKFGMASNPGGPDDLERVLDRVMAELERLDNVEDPDLTASLSKGEVSIMLTVEGVDALDAAGTGLAAIRTALLAAEVATPRWPTFSELVSAEGGELIDA